LLYLAYGTCIIYIGSLYQPPDHIYYGGMVPLSARPVILLFHICRPTVGYSCSYEAYGISHIFYCRHKIAVQYHILYAGLWHLPAAPTWYQYVRACRETNLSGDIISGVCL